MSESKVVEAFQASIANHKKCSNTEERKRGIVYKAKYIIWYLLLLILSPYYEEKSNVFVACMTPLNERRIQEQCKDGHLYRFAKLNSSISAIRTNISVVSGLGRMQRLALLVTGIGFYNRHKDELRDYIHFALEYYAIANFLNSHSFDTYVIPGMFERYSTLISYLGKEYGAKIVGIQDGAAISVDVPYKLYVDEMNCFDEFEADIIKTFIKNTDCKFNYTGFKSVIEWNHLEKKEKKVMAIAGQDWFTGKTIELVSEIMDSDIPDSWDIILLPHYRESEDDYRELSDKYTNLLVESKRRFDNIDLLITYYSTIVYDYWSVNKDIAVYCLQIPGYTPGYYGRNNVTVFNSIRELVDSVANIKQGA